METASSGIFVDGVEVEVGTKEDWVSRLVPESKQERRRKVLWGRDWEETHAEGKERGWMGVASEEGKHNLAGRKSDGILNLSFLPREVVDSKFQAKE